MPSSTLRRRVLARDYLAGLFVKTASHEIVELLALSGVDFVCFDAEHSPYDRAGLDVCLALANARGLPALVRVTHAAPEAILSALDCGADGVLVPHVDSLAKARDVARWSRYGPGGRGAAPTNRAGGFGTIPMSELRRRSREETVVLAMAEDPSAVEEIEEIAALDGIDGLFAGLGDLTVSYEVADASAPVVQDAFKRISAAAAAHGKALAAVANPVDTVPGLRERGMTMAFVGSEHNMILAGGRAIAATKAGG